jgi:two-component system CheB/CheR fusion protein
MTLFKDDSGDGEDLRPGEEPLVDSLNLKNRPFPIVGLGGSAGAFSAIQEFLAEIPSDSGIAFVLVQHLAPDQPSILADLLGRQSNIPVLRVEDGMAVQPDHVYVIPENKEMIILDGRLLLMQPSKPRGRRMPIDSFLQSLASDWGEKAVCAIFSGMGSDGETGARFIKEGLGLVMVQAPTSAQYESMPRSIIESDNPDYVDNPRDMARKLLDYVQSPFLHEIKKEGLSRRDAQGLQKIFALLRNGTGHDFSLYKKSTILRRLERRMRMYRFSELDQYVQYLEDTPAEVQTLFKELLIGVTKFFRDYPAFELLETQLLPELVKRRKKNEPLRIWVAGSSSGEEVYSVAILVQECLERLRLRNVVKVQMFATDLDTEAIKKARYGIYPDNVANDISAERLERWFIQKDSTYQVVPEIREMIIFAEHNLIKDASFTNLDLLCCRNVLIYFTPELQRKLLPVFHYTLREGGVLFLGPSETISGFDDLFTPVDSKWKIFRRRENSVALTRFIEFPAQTSLPKQPRPASAGEEVSLAVTGKHRSATLQDRLNRLLLQRHTPPALLINGQGELVYIHGRTGKYLEPAPGQYNANVYEMAREGLLLELRGAVLRASTQAGPVVVPRVNVKTNGHYQLVKLTVEQLTEPEELEGLLLVTFEDLPNPKKPVVGRGKPAADSEKDKFLEQMEHELAFTRQHLQQTIEQMQTTVEELKSANEELQSTNEELQSTNEESNTAKEEMQALNEELMTVNLQFRGKTDELTEVNNDMANLLNSAEIATVFLSSNLHVKRFTPSITGIIPLVQTDVGRPITHLTTHLKYEHLVADVKEVLARLSPKEVEVESTGGQWYQLRIIPYRTLDNFIGGAVLSFHEITPRKRMELQLQAAREMAKDLLDALPGPALVLDGAFGVVAANASFLRTFRLEEGQVQGRSFYRLGNGPWDAPALRTWLEGIMAGTTSDPVYATGTPGGMLGTQPLQLRARRLRNGVHEAPQILVTLEEGS